MCRLPLAGTISTIAAGMLVVLGCVGDGEPSPPVSLPDADSRDGGGDAPLEASTDASVQTWCSTRPDASVVVCEDFDMSGDITSRGWANEVSNASAPEVGSTVRRSEPHALRVIVPADVAGSIPAK